MAEDKGKQLQAVDLAGVGNLLEELVVKDMLTCGEWARIVQRMVAKHNFPDYKLSILVGYQRSKEDVLKRTAHKELAASQHHKANESYVSLTKILREHSSNAPGYVIQSWLRSGNALAFLNLCEKDPPDYCEAAYVELLEQKKAEFFTLTPRLWIERTKAIDIVSKHGKARGHILLAILGAALYRLHIQ